MTFLRSVLRTGAPAALLVLCAITDARDADACGGCFHPSVDLGGTVVTDHRMVFEITSQQTILWDQVRYMGDPSQFAWVLPVRAGARIELSRGEWISALDAATHTTVQGPRVMCPPVVPLSKEASAAANPPSSSRSSSGSSGSSGTSGSSGSVGCGGGGGTSGGYANGNSESTPSLSGSSGGDDTPSDAPTPMFVGNDDVAVVSEESIGPYQAVTIRANGLTGISEWLVANGFVIPPAIAPVVDAFTLLKFDFIALKLAPNQGVRAMRPIRVVVPGADTTLPLRMIAAGAGAKIGVTLWVIGEGRYRTQNFPEGTIDWSTLAWDVPQGRSNRAELEAAALASNNGRSWITEAAVRTSLTESKAGSGLPNVYDAYTSQCAFRPPHNVPCDETALPPPDGKPSDLMMPDMPSDPDAGDAGAGDPDAGDPDAGADSGADAGPVCVKVVRGCDGFDDLDVAAATIHPADVWVTRLRADLPMSALATDLVLQAAEQQVELDPAHKTSTFNPPYDPCAAVKAQSAQNEAANAVASRVNGGNADSGCSCRTASFKDGLGTWLLVGLTMIALPFVTRRRRERERERERDRE